MFTRCGSLSYAAPELFVANGYNPFKADVWSLGICLCTLLFSRLPFDVASPRSEAFATFREANRLQKGSVLDEFLACRPECVAAVDVLKVLHIAYTIPNDSPDRAARHASKSTHQRG